MGRAVRQGDVTRPAIEIVGVAGDARTGAIDRDVQPVIYRPHEQWSSGPMTVVVRTAQEPAALAPAVRGVIRGMDPGVPIPAVRTMREIVSSTVAERRLQMLLTSLFALVALVICVVGVYGVVSMIAQFFNTSAFMPVSQVPRGTYGNVPKNAISGPAQVKTDLAISRSFRLPGPEGLRLQLRGELFDAFNQVNFREPVANASSTSFGRARVPTRRASVRLQQGSSGREPS